MSVIKIMKCVTEQELLYVVYFRHIYIKLIFYYSASFVYLVRRQTLPWYTHVFCFCPLVSYFVGYLDNTCILSRVILLLYYINFFGFSSYSGPQSSLLSIESTDNKINSKNGNYLVSESRSKGIFTPKFSN